jgi:hypothetical protein
MLDGRLYKNDKLYYGLAQGNVEEWGDFSEAELKSLYPKVWEVP